MSVSILSAWLRRKGSFGRSLPSSQQPPPYFLLSAWARRWHVLSSGRPSRFISISHRVPPRGKPYWYKERLLDSHSSSWEQLREGDSRASTTNMPFGWRTQSLSAWASSLTNGRTIRSICRTIVRSTIVRKSSLFSVLQPRLSLVFVSTPGRMCGARIKCAGSELPRLGVVGEIGIFRQQSLLRYRQLHSFH
jgi:hypothetical protein